MAHASSTTADSITLPLASTTFSSESVSEFVQDEWQAGRAVTLNLGARHDIGNSWDPRAGMTWLPRARFLMRGSYGRFSSPLADLAVRQGSAGCEIGRNLRTFNDAVYPVQAGQPEGRLAQLGVRLLF